MSYDVYWVKNVQKKIADFEHPTLQGVNAINPPNPGCRFACPGLCATLGFQPALAKSETSVCNKYVKLYVMYVLALSDYK